MFTYYLFNPLHVVFFLADLQLEFQIPCDLTDRRGGGGGGGIFGGIRCRTGENSILFSRNLRHQGPIAIYANARAGRGGRLEEGEEERKSLIKVWVQKSCPGARASSSQVRVHTHSMNTEQENKERNRKTDRCDRLDWTE